MARDARLSDAKLSHTAALILHALDAGFVYGFSIMEMTGLPSGTVYPAMRRLERDELIRSHWERQSIADAEQRPPRKYYKLTAAGKVILEASRRRYPLLERLIPTEEARTV
jgi:PadR family transcriptional regulator, regulatory protein PadR